MTTNHSFFVSEDQPWFSKEAGWPDEVPKNMEFEELPLGEMLRQSVTKFPNHKAVWFLDSALTYKQLDEMVDRLATAMDKTGLKAGDVSAALLPNSFQYVIHYYACARLGVVSSGINPTYKAQEVLHQLKTVNAKALLCLDALYEPSVAPIREQSPVKILMGTNITDLVSSLPGWKKWLGKKLGKIPSGPMPADTIWLNEMMKSEPNPPKVAVNAHDAATYIMTGGTTGVPKAAVLSHFNCVSNAKQALSWIYKIDPGSCCVGVLPLFHSFAMTCVMNLSLVGGAWMMLFPRPPKQEELIDTILKIGPDNGVCYVGAEILFQRLAEVPGIAESGINQKLALCVSGAGPLHRPVQKMFEENTGARLVEGYGLTESTPVVSANPFWGNRKIGTIGLPFPGTDWRIVDSVHPQTQKAMVDETNGEEADQETHMGEIAVAGPQVMVGYLNKPSETDQTIIEMDGKRWLLTGDIGYMDTEGRIAIRDRKKQLIKYKGYSVFPKEVEELVGAHESVSEVAVAGLPDRETGEKIKAWVVLKPNWQGKITEEELLAWCKENMTHYKVPAYLDFIEELPKTLVGKVLRRELMENDPIYKEYFKNLQ